MMPGQPMMNNNAFGNNGYNPDVFEYDDELPEGEVGERVILSDDPIPVEIGVVKTIGTKKMGGFGGARAGEDHFQDWEDDEDDERIEEFLSS